MGDNLDHLQDNMRLTAHINSSQTRMANLEQKLTELGELFLVAMRQSSSEAGTQMLVALGVRGPGTSDYMLRTLRALVE